MYPAKWVLSNAALPVSVSVGSAVSGLSWHYRAPFQSAMGSGESDGPDCESWLALCPP